MKEIEQAEKALREAEEQFGKDDPRLAPHLEKLAALLRSRKLRLLEAANMLARAEVLRQDQPQVSQPTMPIEELRIKARHLYENGQFEQAIPLLRDWMSRVQGNNEQMLIVLSALAACLARTGDREISEVAYQRAFEIGANKPGTLESLQMEYKNFKDGSMTDPIWTFSRSMERNAEIRVRSVA